MDRLDKIDHKLEEIHKDMKDFINVSTRNTNDISWLRGITKINFTLLTTILLSIIGLALKSVFIK